MRTVFKYPIPATGDVRIELPMNAKLVLCDTQGASFNPVLWFEIERDNDHEMRTFRVFGTGHDIPDGYEHMGSVNHEMTGLVWHVYEKSDTETRRWSDDLTDRERIIANTSPDGLWAAASLRSEVSEPLYVCNKCGFPGTTSPHRGCNYFAAPAPSEGIETPPSDVMTRLANLGIDSDDLIGTIRSLRADLEAANREALTAQNENKVLHSSNNTLRSRINRLTAQLEAANKVVEDAVTELRVLNSAMGLEQEKYDGAVFQRWNTLRLRLCSTLAKLSSYRRSPDSNTQGSSPDMEPKP
jgi:hypothetical protein